MELSQLKYFIISAESSSFADAANKLFVSRQALSKSITSLEAELGTTLFERTKGGIMLTKTGLWLYPTLKEKLNYFDGLAEEVASFEGKKHINMRMMFSHCIMNVFSDCVDQYKNAHPESNIDVSSNTEICCKQAFESNQVDAICITSDMGVSPKVRRTQVYENDLVLVMNKSNPLSALDFATAKDIITQNVIIIDSETFVANYIQNLYHNVGKDSGMELIYTNGDHWLSDNILSKNSGVLILSRSHAEHRTWNNCTYIPYVDKNLKYRLYLYVKEDNDQAYELYRFCRIAFSSE